MPPCLPTTTGKSKVAVTVMTSPSRYAPPAGGSDVIATPVTCGRMAEIACRATSSGRRQGGRAMSTSGSNPPVALRKSGASHLSVVSCRTPTSVPSGSKRYEVWPLFLPKVRCPTTVARSWSCKAAVTISEAEAVLPSTTTTIGKATGSGATSLPRARTVSTSSLPTKCTMTDRSGRKTPAVPTAVSTYPPGLALRSSTRPLTG